MSLTLRLLDSDRPDKSVKTLPGWQPDTAKATTVEISGSATTRLQGLPPNDLMEMTMTQTFYR